MKTKKLKDLLIRVEGWPKKAQLELATVAQEIESELGDSYSATSDELKGIDRGLLAAQNKDMATKEEVAAVFAKFRKA